MCGGRQKGGKRLVGMGEKRCAGGEGLHIGRRYCTPSLDCFFDIETLVEGKKGEVITLSSMIAEFELMF